MRADSITLKRLFDQTIQYKIPLFQRPYVWNENDNWRYLWEDILLMAKRLLEGKETSHFLGAIVLEQIQNRTGRVELRQVIDGQQRLTTLQVLFAVMRNICEEKGLNTYKNRFAKYAANDADFTESEEETFKVLPTNIDRPTFKDVLMCKSNTELIEKHKRFSPTEKPRLYEVYFYFYNEIITWLNADVESNESIDKEKVEILWCVLSQNLQMVTIDLEVGDDAQVIFETLNSRGTALLPADLIKNHLFQKAEADNEDAGYLYKTYWSEFDKDFWRKEVKQGRLKRPRIDLFFWYYLSLKTREVFPITHVYGTFKKHVFKQGWSTEEYLKELTKYSEVFKSFFKPKEGSRLEAFIERLDAIDTNTVFPTLMEIGIKNGNDTLNPEFAGVVSILESFLIRRLICGLTTKNYNRLMLDIVRHCEKSNNYSAAFVEEYLLSLTGDSVRWPDSNELINSMVRDKAYSRISQKRIKMVLLAIDKHLHQSFSEKIDYQSSLNIEHVLPQQWETNWPIESKNPEQLQSLIAKRHNALHHWGNLTLVTGKLNTNLSNSGWSEKRLQIFDHSKLNLNKYFRMAEKWNEESITARSKVLAKSVIEIWLRQETENVYVNGDFKKDFSNSIETDSSINETDDLFGIEAIEEMIHDLEHSDKTMSQHTKKYKKRTSEFVVFGKQHYCRDATEAMIIILREIEKRYSGTMEQLSIIIKKGTRNHISRDKYQVYPNNEKLTQSHVKKLNDEWFIGYNISNREKEDFVKTACHIAGIKFGKDIIVKF